MPAQPLDGHAGHALIEVLIAALVLAIGLLGLAGLQAAAMRGNHDAALHTQAVLLAADMADSLRAYKAVETGRVRIPPAETERWNRRVPAVLPAGKWRVYRTGSDRFSIAITWNSGGRRAELALQVRP